MRRSQWLLFIPALVALATVLLMLGDAFPATPAHAGPPRRPQITATLPPPPTCDPGSPGCSTLFLPLVLRAYERPSIVTGSVLLQEGACCAGGIWGQPLEIRADFSATSAAGEVFEMRQSVGGSCATATSNLADRPWRPFVDLMLFSISPPPNWSTFAVAAQYRDDHGHVSPVYCDDIAVEGMPPTPSITTPGPG